MEKTAWKGKVIFQLAACVFFYSGANVTMLVVGCFLGVVVGAFK